MAKAYNYTITGTGRTETAALKDAEGKLPKPLSDVDFYARLHTGDAQQVNPRMYKVEIKYDVHGESPATRAEGKRVRGKPSSFGGNDPFACTRAARPARDITDAL